MIGIGNPSYTKDGKYVAFNRDSETPIVVSMQRTAEPLRSEGALLQQILLKKGVRLIDE